MKNVKHIVIFEPRLSGHRINYLNIISSNLISNGYQLVVILDSNFMSESIKPHLIFIDNPNVQIVPIKLPFLVNLCYSKLKLYFKEIVNYYLIEKYLKKVKKSTEIKLLIIPYFDHVLRISSFFQKPFYGIDFIGITMNISFHLHKINVDIHRPNVYRRKLEYYFFNKILRKKNLVSLLTIDPLLYNYTRNINSKKVDYLPDPVSFNDTPTSKEEARWAIGIYQKLPIVLVYGSITVRKGVLDLLEAFCSSSIRNKYLILIAGKIEKPLIKPIAEFSENHKNIIVHNKYINKNEEHYYFKASDINWCGYKNFDKISAVYVQGSLYGLPAISSNNGLIGYFTRKNENGICINSTTKESIYFALHQLSKQKLYEKMAINGRHFASDHIEEKSLANLNKHIFKITRNN